MGSRHILPWLLLLLAGSGCAALIYEIVWFQLLQLVIGSSAVSLGLLLAAYMGGLCLGSAAFARLVSLRQHPLRVYAFLELGIAAFGGQPVTSSTSAVSPPAGFFRANEFETGAFGTFATGVGSSANSDSHAWGGGLDVTHWLPWKYGGIRFQGTGTNTR